MTRDWATSDIWEELQGDGLAPEFQAIGWMTGEDVWIAKSFKWEMTRI